jgi:hypothetical protein
MAELHKLDLIYFLFEVELDLVFDEKVIEGLFLRFHGNEKRISINK